MHHTARICCVLALLVLPGLAISAGTDVPRTRAERTGFLETTRYAEAMVIMERAAAVSPRMHLARLGYTTQGRRIPLLVIGDVVDGSPAAARQSGRLRVYLQGNIHGGEVAGKEALLMLIRELAVGDRAGWADHLVLLVGPIFNADGNEAIRLTNRPLQHGPVGGMGTRSNAQGFDLNRDHMKLDSPEGRSVVRLMSTWDPHVSVDLHTTNGTHHGYHLTYSPPLHPATPAVIDDLLREEWLPRITERIHASDGWAFYHYGNVLEAPGTANGAWVTFDHRPRFGTNYAGIRNRIGILSESYAYLPFEERVRVSYRLVEEILDQAAAQQVRIKEMLAAEDARQLTGERLALRAVPRASPQPVEILMGEVVEERHPYTGDVLLRRADQVHAERMPEYVAFETSEDERVPAAYLVPAGLGDVVDRLEAHGVGTRALDSATRLEVEAFRITSSEQAAEPFQGRYARIVQGRWTRVQRDLPPGTVVVDMNQPLVRLAFLLLEPRADDGLLSWGLLDDHLGDEYPILRSHRKP